MLRISRLTDYATVLLAALAGEPERVQTAANQLGLRLDEFVEKSLDAALSRKETVKMAFDYVLRKNAELYRRLAK